MEGQTYYLRAMEELAVRRETLLGKQADQAVSRDYAVAHMEHEPD